MPREERSQRRGRSVRGDRGQERHREGRQSRPPSSRPRNLYDEEETSERIPRARRRSRSHSQAGPSRSGLSAEALAALNNQIQQPLQPRQSQRPSRRDGSRNQAVRATSREARRKERKSRTYADPCWDSRDNSGGYRNGYRDSREYRQSRDYNTSGRGYRDETREERLARRTARQADRERDYGHENERLNAEATEDEYRQRTRRSKKRLVSGAVMEEGIAVRRNEGSRPESEEYMLNEKEIYQAGSSKKGEKRRWNKKRIIIFASAVAILLIITTAVAVVVSKKKSGSDSEAEESDIDNIDPDSIPAVAKGTYLDPYSWYDTTDFNLTYTNQTVGNLPVMGLFDEWDDSAQASNKVPPLNKNWGSYSDNPARGVNLGGWLNLEPFITPSLFEYDSDLGIIDEWTLCAHLGDEAQATLERHYASFVTEQTFAAIADAGLDHVRIPYGYWAVQTYDGDPYLFRTSWRYLLRGIEWARKYGLRVNLDIHGLPGSQNGWNHSGRQGAIGWLNGTDGELNAQRSLDVHDRLSKFFAQDRYKNIIAFYGLANEPKMTALDASAVTTWTAQAYELVRDNGVKAVQVFGDGFMGLDNWQGQLTGYGDTLALDVHQYVIFNVNQIVFTHQEKIKYACDGWTAQSIESMDTDTGFGPTLFAEWSQADTDCTRHLNNVGEGNRWEGTYNPQDGSGTPVTSPRCPTQDATCTCSDANADPARWSDEYKLFLRMFAEAQMHSFERGWGWWYWTWETESAPQWSYRAGLAAGVLPTKAWQRDFNCDTDVPDFSGLPEYY